MIVEEKKRVNEEEKQLELACLLLAQAMLLFDSEKPVDTDTVTKYAGELASEAVRQYEEILGEPGCSLPMVTRAIHYLRCLHKIPQVKDISWFSDALELLLEVVCPRYMVSNDQAKEFLLDMQIGISRVVS
nr:MAG: hypothetical protein BECKTUN1418F_GA0071002_11188 [Candidatus Kentron sp. TUN]VFK65941.1 MAG: hypothetical protein BECKTUN1418E_GA0071001_11178 [Candidatus Kentron sp. TUN]